MGATLWCFPRFHNEREQPKVSGTAWWNYSWQKLIYKHQSKVHNDVDMFWILCSCICRCIVLFTLCCLKFGIFVGLQNTCWVPADADASFPLGWGCSVRPWCVTGESDSVAIQCSGLWWEVQALVCLRWHLKVPFLIFILLLAAGGAYWIQPVSQANFASQTLLKEMNLQCLQCCWLLCYVVLE